MGIFDVLFARKEPAPEAPKRGPSNIAPDPLTTIPPYYPATRGFSYPPHAVDRSARLRYHESPSNGRDWSGYHTQGRAEWEESNDVKWSVPQPSNPREQLKAPDVRWEAGQPLRPGRAVSTYRAVQPFNQRTATRLNGNHFSLAGDEKPSYLPRGMRPQTRARTIWRVTPIPQNVRTVDSMANVQSVRDTGYRSPVLPIRDPLRRLR